MPRLRLTILLLLLTLQLAGCAFHRAVERAEQFETAGDFESAVAAYEDALALDPDDDDVARRLEQARLHAAADAVAEGHEHLAAGRYRETRTSVLRALQHSPNHADAQSLRASMQDAVAAGLAPPSRAPGAQAEGLEIEGAGLERAGRGDSDPGLAGRWREAQFWCEAEGAASLCSARDAARDAGLARAGAALEERRYDDARDAYGLYAQIEPAQQREARRLRGEVDQREAADFRDEAHAEIDAGNPELALILISRASTLSGSRDDERVRSMLRDQVSAAASLPLTLDVTGTGARADQVRREISGRVERMVGAHLAPGGEPSTVRVHAPVCSESSLGEQRSLRYVHHIQVVPNPQVAVLDRELVRADQDIAHWQAEADRAERRAARAQREFHVARERDNHRQSDAIAQFEGELERARHQRREAVQQEKRAARELEQAQRAVDEVARIEERRREVERELRQAQAARDEVRRSEGRVRELETQLQRLRRDNTPDSRAVQRRDALRERVAAARAARDQAQHLQEQIDRLDEQIRKLRALAQRDVGRRDEIQAKIDALQKRRRELAAEHRRQEGAARDLARLTQELERVEARASVGRNEEAIARVQAELETARRELNQARGRAEAADRLAQRLRELDQRLRTARSACPNVATFKTAYARAERDLAQATAVVERCRELLDAAKHRWVRPPEVVERRRRAREAELEFVRVKERCDAAFDHHEHLERDLAATPRTVEEPVFAVHTYQERTWTRQCVTRLTVVHEGRTNTFTREARTEDRSHVGYAPAGLADDPKEYPRADASLISASDAALVADYTRLVETSVDARRAEFERRAGAADDHREAAREYVRALLVDPRRDVPAPFRQLLREEFGADAAMLTRAAQPVTNR